MPALNWSRVLSLQSPARQCVLWLPAISTGTSVNKSHNACDPMCQTILELSDIDVVILPIMSVCRLHSKLLALSACIAAGITCLYELESSYALQWLMADAGKSRFNVRDITQSVLSMELYKPRMHCWMDKCMIDSF